MMVPPTWPQTFRNGLSKGDNDKVGNREMPGKNRRHLIQWLRKYRTRCKQKSNGKWGVKRQSEKCAPLFRESYVKELIWRNFLQSEFLCLTVLKLQNFSVTHYFCVKSILGILEVQTAIRAHLEALNLDMYAFLHCLKAEFHQIHKFQRPLNCRKQQF